MRIITDEEIKEIKFLLDTRQILKAKQKIFNLPEFKEDKEKKENEQKKES